MDRIRTSQTIRLELMDGRKGSALVAGTPTVLIFASRAFVRQDDSFVYIEHAAQQVRIIELPRGMAQFHLTLVTDEDEFLDVDEPTGCTDDLMVTVKEFE